MRLIHVIGGASEGVGRAESRTAGTGAAIGLIAREELRLASLGL